MTIQRGGPPVGHAARMEHVLATESADCALTHLLSLADALDELEVAVSPGDPFTDEHPCVVPLDKPKIERNS